MAISILPPALPVAEDEKNGNVDSDMESDDGGARLGDDNGMLPNSSRHSTKRLVTPGEVVTDEPEWMR